MLLNANQIEKFLKLEHTKGKKANVGYDLSLKRVQTVQGGYVYNEHTTVHKYKEVPIQKYNIENEDRFGYLLSPNVYAVTFHEGCKIPPNATAWIVQRSSLLRSGTVLTSSIFDPGFETENIGSVMILHYPLFIEKDSRIAQMFFHENTSVEESDLYNGQFQGK